jgi:outer membrane immunogenic protein
MNNGGFRVRIAAALVSALIVSPAFAADMPATKAPVYAAPASPSYLTNWNGLYAGVNLGGGWASASNTLGSNTLSGIVGGGQIGYNWQIIHFVLGLEGDFQGSGQSRSDVIGPVTVNQHVPWFGTARARVGYTFDNILLYGTGGAAWVDYKVDATLGGLSASSETSKAAWVLGAGVDWMFVPKWSARLEYLYLDTGNTTVTLFNTPFSGRLTDNIVRAGVNYHF